MIRAHDEKQLLEVPFTYKLRKPFKPGLTPPVTYRKDMELRFYVDRLEWVDYNEDGRSVYMDEVGIIGNRAGLLYLAKQLISMAYADDPDEALSCMHHRRERHKDFMPGVLHEDSLPACICRMEIMDDMSESDRESWLPKRKEYKRRK